MDEIERISGVEDILISLSLKPVSLQADREKKNIVINAIREELKEYDFLLSSDVQVEIEWLIHERMRHESHLAPDVDNIIKPILDALSGPDGVIINDCQVQAITCYWVDTTQENQEVTIRVRNNIPDIRLPKHGLFFVRFTDQLCFPFVKGENPPDLTLNILDGLEQAIETRDIFLKSGADYYTAQMIMTSQRFFHTMHALKFDIVEISTFRAELENELIAFS